MSGGRGDPLRAFATSGIVPGPHLDFAQFWDLRANIHGLCCVRWWAVPLLGHRTPGTGSHLRATGLCVVVGLALLCHRTAIREAFRSLYRGFSKSLHFVIPLQTNATRTPDSDSGLGLWFQQRNHTRRVAGSTDLARTQRGRQLLHDLVRCSLHGLRCGVALLPHLALALKVEEHVARSGYARGGGECDS